MIRIIICLHCCLLISFAVFAQKTVIASGEALVRVESYQSIDEVIQKSFQMACVNAIENAFGKVIMQGNSTYMQNTQTGDKVESLNVFNFISDSYVNGEWLETLNEKKEILHQKDGSTWISAQVKGKVREINSPIISIEVETLSCDSILCKTNSFNYGQNLFFHILTAKSGYVSIYLDDPEIFETSRIFPYQSTKDENVSNNLFQPEKTYVLFSKRFDYFNDKSSIDELFLECQAKSIQYKLFVLFSPQPLIKPIMVDKSSRFLSETEQKLGISIPKSMESERFQSWLQKIRSADPTIELSCIYINLNK